MLASCLALPALIALVALDDPQDLLAHVRLELAGPLKEVHLVWGEVSETRLELDLAAGETRSLSVPFGGGQLLPADLPFISVAPGAGRAVLGSWSDDGERRARWQRLPDSLRGRARPPAAAHSRRPPGSCLAVLGAWACVALGLRRRPRVALGCALGVCWLLSQLCSQGVSERSPSLILLEGDAPSNTWIEVSSGAGSLQVDLERCLRVEASPSGSLDWEGRQGPRGLRWRALRPAALLTGFQVLEPGLRRLDPGLNTWGQLARVWVRSPGQGWRDHGAWSLGEALPGPLQGARDGDGGVRGEPPPGWLLAGLPLDRAALVALLAPSTWPSGRGGTADSTWMRLVGLPIE